ncbi:MAG TPA: OmpA family protein [Bacteroidales bacterium]|nr:OmpA family protein [Bacteroidales bacterium]
MLREILHGKYPFRFINSCISREMNRAGCLVFFFLLGSTVLSSEIIAQQYHTTSAKALKFYKSGMTAFDYIDYPNAEKLFKLAIETDEGFYEAHMMLGDLLLKQRRFAEAASSYQKAVSIDSLFYKPVFFSMASAEMMSGNYERALIHFNEYLALDKTSEKNRIKALRDIKNCEFAIEAIKKPVPFNPESVGEGINTSDDEYWPSITIDGQTLMFTRQSRPGRDPARSRIAQEDFYISYRTEKVWNEATNAGAPLNTPQNEGAQSLSSDGTYMYFTACDRPGGLGSCDIFFSAFNGPGWSYPVNLGSPVNTSWWESQPSVNADGRMLFFSSNRPGGFGGKDIWYTVMKPDKKWSAPKNLGCVINTSGDEISPFIHFDGKTLYFSSDGLPGMGGLDIYFSRMLEDSTWTEPRNLGYPINTFNDEMGLTIESGGQKAYFSSKRNEQEGKNIYSFNLYEEVQPDPVAYLKGKVSERGSGKLLSAEYELINLSTGKTVFSNRTDEDGDFLVCLPSGYNYGLNISKKGYLFYSENFMFEGDHSAVEPYIKKIFLSPVRVGEKMLLANVFYEVDSWQLRKESLSELNRLCQLLIENTGVKIEIGGYTDSTGSNEHNLSLSEKRALSVVEYLVSKGIARERLQHKGYGNASPVGDNITSEGRRLNRRTEVQITGIK